MAAHHHERILPPAVEHQPQRRPDGSSGLVGRLLVLQRAVGNRATVQLLRTIAPAGGDAALQLRAVQRGDDEVQQPCVLPFLQRDPLPRYKKSTDPVIELKAVVTPEGDAWQLTVEEHFSTPEAVWRLIWPSRSKAPPSVSITHVGHEKKPPTAHPQGVVFELTGIFPIVLRTMDPLFVKLFADLGLIEESASIKQARAAFRASQGDLSKQVLDNIDTALKRVTRNNPGLLEAYYLFYSGWKLTDDIDRSSGKAGVTDQTIGRGGFTDINSGVLHLLQLPLLPTDNTLSFLGETLIHEYVHTSHVSNILKGPGEGKAYGIENFFAERLGDKQREKASSDLVSHKM